MSPKSLVGLAPILLAYSVRVHATPPDSPSFEQRVEAQEAIERVYHRHLVGETRSFEQAVPRRVIEQKVRTYLQQSELLRERWHTEITPQALHRELERIAGGTRMPDRLFEVYAALGNDPLLLEECLARPVLVDRLTRSFFAADDLLHRDARAEAGELRRRLAAGIQDPEAPDPRRIELLVAEQDTDESQLHRHSPGDPEREPLDHEAFARFRASLPAGQGEPGPIVEETDRLNIEVLVSDDGRSVRVARYTVPKLRWDTWWQEEQHRWRPQDYQPMPRAQAALSPPRPSIPASDAEASPAATTPRCTLAPTWQNGVLDDFPKTRDGHTAIWTGSMMVIWGGYNYTVGMLKTGGRYDPLIDTWYPLSTLNAPIGRYLHTGIWTGSVMVVWGGYGKLPGGAPLRTGGRYDPVTDTWQPVSLTNAPSARLLHSAVWTGSEMIVWGGVDAATQLGTGRRYDPVRNKWTSVSTVNAPTRRVEHTAVWTGSRMLVWGGDGTGFIYGTGGSYDPATNSWTAIATAGAPTPRALHSATWTGSELIIWGGVQFDYKFLYTGGRYNPATNTWRPMTTTGTPSARAGHVAVWAEDEMIVYGAASGLGPADLQGGGRYNPQSDSWSPITRVGTPPARGYPTGIWTGTHLIVWGGDNTNTGGRYDPAADSWTPVSMLNAPPAMTGHSAYWTGTVMVVWGNQLGAGSRYDPMLDTWSQVSAAGAPGARYGPVIWTGRHLIVWGGEARYWPYGYVNTGAIYDPITDQWEVIEVAGAPSNRNLHVLLWTGSQLLVWGGTDGFSHLLMDGGIYDLAARAWSPISPAGAPGARMAATGLWTGTQMIIWGGTDSRGDRIAGGALYTPATDQWKAISASNAPVSRRDGSVVWTGAELLVWGGYSDSLKGMGNDGGRYDPLTDQWRPTNIFGAPLARGYHLTVWTGKHLIVWGGLGADFVYQRSGGLYDPVLDVWKPMATTGAPAARFRPAIVWTGRLMILWGGQSAVGPGGKVFATGGAYDSMTNTWQATSVRGAPTARTGHTAVWTGNEMIVFGGGDFQYSVNDGGRLGIPLQVDSDLDGFTTCNGDCDGTRSAVHPGATQVCGDGLNNDCTHPSWPSLQGTNEVDDDGDQLSECAGDCDDTRPLVMPGALESCDTIDNDCNGVVDEGCAVVIATIARPPCFPVRAESPMTGSWGQTSWGPDRTWVCPPGATTFAFVDTQADDVAPEALREFFGGVGPSPGWRSCRRERTTASCTWTTSAAAMGPGP